MKSDNLKRLLKTNNKTNVSINESSMIADACKRIYKVCTGLKVESINYNPMDTVEIIEEYISAKGTLDRLLYSQITNYVYSLDEVQRGVFSTNVDKLLGYVLEETDVNQDCKKMIIKIYDHFQLSLYQIENVNTVFATGIEETKENLIKETKKIEKEYVAILGIFASVVLAFVGGMVFSSSVLQSIEQVSIYRLVLVSLIIGLVFVNIIFSLFHYIDKIVRHKSDQKIKPLLFTNVVLIILIISVLISWSLGIVEFRNKNVNEKITENSIMNVELNMQK